MKHTARAATGGPRRHARALALGSVLLLAAAGAQAQEVFTGWQVAGGFDNASVTARADWSSNLGPPWLYGTAVQGGQVVWSGAGVNGASGPYGPLANGVTLDYRLAARGGAAGQTYSGGSLAIAPTQGLGPAVRNDFHLYSVLGANDPGYGISTGTQVRGFFAINLPQLPYQEVHYRVDWTLASSGNALHGQQLFFDGQWRTLAAGSGSFAGTFDAADYLPWTLGRALYPQLIASTLAEDWAGTPGSGRTDLWLTVSFDRVPIAAVPEPGRAAMLALGTLVLAVWMPRRRARRD